MTAKPTLTDALAPALLKAVARIPNARQRRSPQPEADAQRLGKRAALKAAAIAGALALPAGPLGWLTLLPEMRAVWKVQVQLVADIAALYGRKSTLTQEQVLLCLFRRDAAAGALRDLVTRAGERFVVRRPAPALVRMVAAKLAARLARNLLGKGAARWLPVAGAVGLSAYAYRETAQVAEAAVELFGAEEGTQADHER